MCHHIWKPYQYAAAAGEQEDDDVMFIREACGQENLPLATLCVQRQQIFSLHSASQNGGTGKTVWFIAVTQEEEGNAPMT